MVGTIASIAPTLGPVIGGYITDALNWHWLFYINLIPGLLVTIVLVALMVKIDEPELSLLRDADYPGHCADGGRPRHAGIFSGGRHALELVQRAPSPPAPGSPGISLLAFIIRSMMVKNPVVDFRALANRNFALGCFPLLRDRHWHFLDHLP